MSTWRRANTPAERAALALRLRQRQKDVIDRFVRGDAPTDQLPIVRRQSNPYYDEHLSEVLELAVNIGAVMMASGMSATETYAGVTDVVSVYDGGNCAVDIIYNVITVTAHRGPSLPPVTAIQPVHYRSLDFSRLAAVDRLVRRIRAEKLDPTAALAELREITAAPHPYKRWIAATAWGALAFALAGTLGGSLGVGAVSAVSAMVIYAVNRRLNKWDLPTFYQHAVGGVIATAPALGLFAASQHFGFDFNPTTGIAAGLVVLFAGLALVGSFQDAIRGAPVTAAARFFELFMLTGATVSGVGAMLVIGQRFIPGGLTIEGFAAPALSELPVRIAFGGAVSVAFALACYADRRALIASAIGGISGITVFLLVQLTGLSPVLGSFIAAVAVGFVGALLAFRGLTPPLVVAVAGIMPMVPGLTLLHGVYGLVNDHVAEGFGALLSAIAVSMALAAGVTLGEWAASRRRRN